MKLSQYLKKEKLTHSDFILKSKEKEMPISKGALQKWCAGQRIPRKESMMKIAVLTNKEVQPVDFYN